MTNNDGSTLEQKSNSNTPVSAGFISLLACWLYDFMLLCAVWLLAGLIYLIPAQMLSQLDSSEKNNLSTTEFTGPLFYSYLFFVSWFFFAWFWRHGGQTLGLRSWSLRLQTEEGHALSWLQTLLRFLVAATPWLIALFAYEQVTSKQLLASPYQYSVFFIGFIGLFWVFIDKQKRSLYDILSHSRIIKIKSKK